MAETAFIVGASLASISTDLRLDHGWLRCDRTSWWDEDGRKVVYLSDPFKLQGMPKGTLVYLAPGFNQRDDWWRLDEALQRRDCERIIL